MYNFFYSLISFIIALFFILLGIVGVMIPWSANVRADLIDFILKDSLAISLFGFAFIVIGLAIVSNILLNARRSYYHIKSGDHAIAVDEAVIHQYLKHYWKQLYPDHDIPYQLTIKHNKIHLNIDLPYQSVAEQRPTLERIRQDLRRLLNNQLGYQDEFSLSAAFQAAPKKKL